MSKELEDRFHEFARRTRDLCKSLKWDLVNSEYVKQLIKASGSVAANYVEASDNLGKADEKMKIKLARREAKESKGWLRLVFTYDDKKLEEERIFPIDEAEQIKKILSTIINKLK